RSGSTNDGFLDALYQDALNRPPDPFGRAAFNQALAAGASRTAVVQAIFGSLEYIQDLVQGFYLQFLGRSADPFGLDAFTNQLQHGVRDEDVIAQILGSSEYFDKL